MHEDLFRKLFGEDDGKLLSILENDMISAIYEVKILRELYIDNNHKDILSDIAKDFFGTLFEILWNNAIMTIARFTDPLFDHGNRNLSMEFIKYCASEYLDFKAKDSICSIYMNIDASCSRVRNFRRKLIAHRDCDIARAVNSDLIVSINDIEIILGTMKKSFRYIIERYSNASCDYDFIIDNGGIDELMYVLKYYHKASKLHRQIFENRECKYDDLSIERMKSYILELWSDK